MLLPISTTNGYQLTSHSCLLPHRFFAALWEMDQNLFKQHWCGGSDSALATFWEGLRGTRLYGKAAKLGLSKTIPIKLFGDGVAVVGISKSWGKSVDAFLMASLLSNTSTKTSEVMPLDISKIEHALLSCK